MHRCLQVAAAYPTDTSPGGAESAYFLEDGTSSLLLEDGTSDHLLEG